MIPLLFSYLSVASACTFIALGMHAYKQNPKAFLNRLFLTLSLSLATWAFPYSFVYSAPTKEIAWQWYKVSAIGWCTFMSIGSHFLLQLSGKQMGKGWKLYPILYGPPVFFLYKVFFDTLLVEDLIQGPFGWIEILSHNKTWPLIFLTYTGSLLFWSLYIVYKWGKTTEVKMERKQAMLLVKAGFIATCLGIISNLIAPLLNIRYLPALAPILLLIFAWGAYVAITKYKAMSLDPIITEDKILSLIGDMVILLDRKLRIIKCNPQFLVVFGFEQSEVILHDINEIFPEVTRYLTPENYQNGSVELELPSHNREMIPVKMSVVHIYDQFGELAGVVLVIQDIRALVNLRLEIERHKETQRNLQELQKELEQKVEERTSTLLEFNKKLIFEAQEKEKLYQELIKKEESFRMLLESFPDPVAILSSSGEIKYANQAFAQLLQTAEGSFSELLARIKDAYRSGAVAELQMGERQMELRSFSLLGEDVADVVVIRDVTELRKREIELRESQKKYAQILEEIREGYYETDLKGRFVFFNPSWLRTLKLSESELMGMSYKKIVVPEYVDKIFLEFNNVYKNKTPKDNVTVKVIDGKGYIKDLEISICPIIDYQGNITGFRGMARDMTQRKRQEAALKESEERFRILFNTLKYPIFLLDKGIIVDCNPATFWMFGGDRDSIIGKSPIELSPPFQPDGQSSKEKGYMYMKRAWEGESLSFEWQHMRLDGSLFETEVRLERVALPGKVYLLAVIYDITERKRFEEELKLISIKDELTGLYNRRGFKELGERLLMTAARQNKGVFLVFSDLNYLKHINDTYGHSAGDLALKELARILKERFRGDDVVARIGGDEFAVLAMEAEGILDPDSIERRLKDGISALNQLHRLPFEISASIGITKWGPESSVSLEILLVEADRLMYEDKAKKKGFAHSPSSLEKMIEGPEEQNLGESTEQKEEALELNNRAKSEGQNF